MQTQTIETGRHCTVNDKCPAEHAVLDRTTGVMRCCNCRDFHQPSQGCSRP